MKRIKGFLIAAFLLIAFSGGAQKAERQNVRAGNKKYEKDNFTEAEIAYRKSIDVNPRSTEGIFNLGNALYKQEKYPEALEQYQLIAGQGERLLREDSDNRVRVSNVFHNFGNIGMKNKDYQKSIEAYKQALRLNPLDEETRYNLALAQKLLQDQEQQPQDQQQDQQEQEQQEQQQDQNQQDQPQKEQKTQEEPQQNEQMSRDNAQQILDAFLQDEKDTQEKVKKAQQQMQQNRRREKQW